MADRMVVGVAGVLEREGRLLVIRRSAQVEAPGAWCFPGGAVEAGESLAEALVREIREEVGLEVEAVGELGRWERPDGELRIHWWRAALRDPEATPTPDPQEVAEACWMAPSTILELPGLLESNRRFLRDISFSSPSENQAAEMPKRERNS